MHCRRYIVFGGVDEGLRLVHWMLHQLRTLQVPCHKRYHNLSYPNIYSYVFSLISAPGLLYHQSPPLFCTHTFIFVARFWGLWAPKSSLKDVREYFLIWHGHIHLWADTTFLQRALFACIKGSLSLHFFLYTCFTHAGMGLVEIFPTISLYHFPKDIGIAHWLARCLFSLLFFYEWVVVIYRVV